MPRRDFDPYANFNYKLEIDGITNAGFSECSGLNIENTPIEYREGTDGFLTPRKQPGLMKFGNITLKRGVTQNADLVTWLKTVMDGDIERRNVSIVLQDELHQDTVRWNLREAWAVKWTGPDLKANASEMAIETLEIAHEGVVRQ
ncbi:MAG TPA: phage tail protein [Pyrinomonadaceae bacterium]|jgi:phage tail-like protein|nr:phage tail protein [Pyrinomonadaceae bacterium]